MLAIVPVTFLPDMCLLFAPSTHLITRAVMQWNYLICCCSQTTMPLTGLWSGPFDEDYKPVPGHVKVWSKDYTQTCPYPNLSMPSLVMQCELPCLLLLPDHHASHRAYTMSKTCTWPCTVLEQGLQSNLSLSNPVHAILGARTTCQPRTHMSGFAYDQSL